MISIAKTTSRVWTGGVLRDTGGGNWKWQWQSGNDILSSLWAPGEPDITSNPKDPMGI